MAEFSNLPISNEPGRFIVTVHPCVSVSSIPGGHSWLPCCTKRWYIAIQ